MFYYVFNREQLVLNEQYNEIYWWANNMISISTVRAFLTQGTTARTIFYCNSNFIEISFCSNPSCTEIITIKFCTWHDSCAVMPCAQFCSDIMSYNGVTLKPIFHWIWIEMEKLFVQWALAHNPTAHTSLSYVCLTITNERITAVNQLSIIRRNTGNFQAIIILIETCQYREYSN